ncbi:hypothetical protein FIBSPDRAFT_890935 [Athelia psychrophila]|uniref:Uncharacterized protein n=1 Tax=Athelia psychrophila TaxID=1759441 RepID=A0A166KAG2_9AGAM|nr:hypothetical protein FIBSPDRAFT_890935 [Fibularhizoctonia sp. CBS 109695]
MSVRYSVGMYAVQAPGLRRLTLDDLYPGYVLLQFRVTEIEHGRDGVDAPRNQRKKSPRGDVASLSLSPLPPRPVWYEASTDPGLLAFTNAFARALLLSSPYRAVSSLRVRFRLFYASPGPNYLIVVLSYTGHMLFEDHVSFLS